MRGYPNPRLNETATTNPTSADDISAGWEVGSLWVNTSAQTTWQCISNARGAAVWSQTNGAGDALVLITDTMTDTVGTPLSAHTANTGQTWNHVVGVGHTGDLVITGADRVRPDTVSTLGVYYSSERQCYDWDCTADIYCATNANDEVRIQARYDSSNLTSNYYAGTQFVTAREWILVCPSGLIARKVLASDFTPNTTRTVRFVCVGYRMELWVDGVLTLWADVDPGFTTYPGTFALMMGNGNAVGNGAGLQVTNLSIKGDIASFYNPQFVAAGQILTCKPVTGGFSTTGVLPTLLTVGGNGTVLTADSTQAEGIKWGTAPVLPSRAINTNLPLTGGGDLSADRTLDINDFTGDSGSGGTDGAVPAPAAGDAAAGKFLKADATWAVPPTGSGAVVQFYLITTLSLVLGADNSKIFSIQFDSAVSRSMTLPDPTAHTQQAIYYFALLGNGHTLARFGSESIDGVAANQTIGASTAGQNRFGVLVSNGTDWRHVQLYVN